MRLDMGTDHNDQDAPAKAIPELRFLKTLVTGLTLIMGLGIIAIVILLWSRLSQPLLPELPEQITLPDGATAQALTFARDWIVVITETGDVLLYDRAGQLRDQLKSP